MKDPLTVIRNNESLFTSYHQLKRNDIVFGRIRLKPGEEHLLTDLVERGILIIPSATSQLASRSKVFQARIFSDFMLPDTSAIYDLNGLLLATTLYRKQRHNKVVMKQDRKNGGVGIHLFSDIEELYNLASCTACSFPFVLQPYRESYRDLRVVVLDDYVEAYERSNPDNFRQNLHCGGKSSPCMLNEPELQFCRAVMQRGGFPYAHLDLMVTGGRCYLTEINLRGGLQGAQISGEEYRRKINAIHERLLANRQRN